MKSTFLLIIILLSFTSNAQINTKTKWGEVSQAEIDYKQVPFEKEADAVILYEDSKAIFSGTIQTHVYRRIKILNERGIDAANQQLVYYSNRSNEDIDNIKAQTINFENNKIVISPVEKKSIFDVTLNEYYNAKKFTFPNAKVGSIIELQYTLTDRDLYFIDGWVFQHEYPTLYSQLNLKNEMGLDYMSLMTGEKIVHFAKGKKDLSNLIIVNLPSYNSIDFLYNPKDMAERVIFQLRGYMKSTGFDNSGSTYKNVLSTWRELNDEINNHYSYIKSHSVGKEIAAIIPNGKNQKETLLNVYNYFKQNYRWNNFYSIYANQSNREVAKIKLGNSTDLNLLLSSVLANKEFKSDLVLLSTRDNGKIVATYPFLGQFNMMVNLVTLSDGSIYLIDASDLENDLGYMPLRNYNHAGLLINAQAENFLIVNQPLSEFHSTQSYNLKDGKMNLVRTDKVNGYFKIKNQENQEGTLEYNPLNNSLDVLMNEKKKDEKEDDEKFQLTKTLYESENALQAKFIGIENPLKDVIAQYKLEEDDRERPLEFNFPFYYKTDVIVNIPDGYKVEIPNDFKSHHELKSKEIIYFQNAETKDGKLIFHIEFYMKKSIFSEDYKEIKSFFEKSNLDASKTILLKKI